METVICVKNVTKKFKVYYDKGASLKEKILFRNRNHYEERLVLDRVSFEVKKGEAIGLIGHNGCGKSTLLKLMTKIMYPYSGSIEIKGRISCLIELGAGFHPDMSGRENIYTNASIFGLTKKEIDQRLNDIISFSELEEFIDNPVRTYSSGMYMRLAFSVAINVNADVLLIDEILAVGDVAFQEKCFNRLREIKSRGTTIVIVSHSLGEIEKICDRSLWINDGKIVMADIPRKVHPLYMEYMGRKSHTQKHEISAPAVASSDSLVKMASSDAENPAARITKVSMIGENGKPGDHFRTGERVLLQIDYQADTSLVDHPIIGLKLYRVDNIVCYGTNTQNERINVELKSEGSIVCVFEKLNLVTGEYLFDIAIRSQSMFAYHYLKEAIRFTVYSTIYEEGIAHIDHFWMDAEI